jgi:HK97 family phage prohead protease
MPPLKIDLAEIKPAGPERRYFTPGIRVEKRAEVGGLAPPPMIVGHAAVFDQWTVLYDSPYWTWREIVRPGAYKNAIAEKQDVRSLFNHDANYVLGRTTSGTLRISEDAAGLYTETDPPDTQIARDLVVSIQRGDVTGMSIAFCVRSGSELVTTETDGKRVIEDSGQRVTIWREGDKMIEEREILDADLFDISPVTYPAFPQTDVSIRSFGERREQEIRKALTRRVGPNRRALAERRLRLALAD